MAEIDLDSLEELQEFAEVSETPEIPESPEISEVSDVPESQESVSDKEKLMRSLVSDDDEVDELTAAGIRQIYGLAICRKFNCL